MRNVVAYTCFYIVLRNTLKNSVFDGLRFGNAAMSLEAIFGAPSETDQDDSIDCSYVAQRWHDIIDLLERKVHLPPRAHRDAMGLGVARILDTLACDKGAFIDNEDGSYTLGSSSWGFRFVDRSARVTNVRLMSSNDLNKVGYLRATTDAGNCGRTTLSVRTAIAAVRVAATGGTFTAQHAAITLVDRVLADKRRPSELAALSTSTVTKAQIQRVAMAMHPALVTEINGLSDPVKFSDGVAIKEPGLSVGTATSAGASLRVPSVRVDAISGNRRLRELKLWPVVTRKDFGAGCPPHVAYVYIVKVTMTRKQWLAEYQRVIIKGERVSLLFGEDLPLGYRIMLVRMSKLVDLSADDALLTCVYIGQERRGRKSKGKFGRVLQHTTWAGCRNIAELKFTTDRRTGYVCMPVGPVFVDYGIAALLPGGEDFAILVNAAEAFVFAALQLVPGFVCCNDSPPGEKLRLLAETYAGPPRIISMCMELIQGFGNEEDAAKIRLSDPDVARTFGSSGFLRSALETMHLLMEHGHYVDKDGKPYPPDYDGRAAFGRYSILTLVSALVASVLDGESGSHPHGTYTCVPWCNACNCPHVAPLCKHLITTRIVLKYHDRPVMWHGDADVLYWGQGSVHPSYAIRCLSKKRAEPDEVVDPAACAALISGIPAKAAIAMHLLALSTQRLASDSGDASSALANLQRLDATLNSFISRLVPLSGATLQQGITAQRGRAAGQQRKAAKSAYEVDSDRVAGAKLYETLTPADQLQRLSAIYPLPPLSSSKLDVTTSIADVVPQIETTYNAAFFALRAAASASTSSIMASGALPQAEDDPCSSLSGTKRIRTAEAPTSNTSSQRVADLDTDNPSPTAEKRERRVHAGP